jgi:vitamin B12 transporter
LPRCYFCLFRDESYAQNTIAGHIKSLDGLPIPGATIRLKAITAGASSDSIGNYKLSTKLNVQCWVFCSAVGYQTDSALIVPGELKFKLEFMLKDAQNELAAVTV